MAEVLTRLQCGGSGMSADLACRSVLHVRALGTTVAIDVADDALVEPLERAWEAVLARGGARECPRVRTPGPPADGADVPPTTLASTLSHITQDVTRAAIEARAGELFMFHAGALSDQVVGGHDRLRRAGRHGQDDARAHAGPRVAAT